MKKFLIVIVTALIIGVALFPRSVEVLNHNYLFEFDQGYDYLQTQQIVIGHKLTLIGREIGSGSAGISGIFQGPFYFYLLAVPFIPFKGDPYGGLVLMWVLSLASVVAGFFLGRKLFGLAGGLLLAFFMAASPPLIATARFVWSPYPATLFLIATFYCVLNMTKGTGAKWFFLAAFLGGFVYNFEIAIAVPLCIAILLYSLLILRVKDWKVYALLFLGLFLGFLPTFLFELRHHFMGIQGMLIYLASHKTTVQSASFATRNSRHLDAFLLNFIDTFPKQAYITLWPMLIALFASVIVFVKREKDMVLRRFLLFLLILPIVAFLIFTQIKTDVYSFYLMDMTLVYLLLFVYVIVKSFSTKFLPIKIVWGGVVIILAISAIGFSYANTIRDYGDVGATAKIQGKTAAIDYIYKDAKGKPFSVFVFTPPVYTYPYDYLFSWYGKKTYGYVPGDKKEGTFYLLIDPDPSKPWSANGWIETVIKSGTLVSTKHIDGFIIQKRVVE